MIHGMMSSIVTAIICFWWEAYRIEETRVGKTSISYHPTVDSLLIMTNIFIDYLLISLGCL